MIYITRETFISVAATYYDDIAATDLDFQEDLRRFLLIRRLLNVYRKSGELKYRLILNHIIIILNVFGDAAVDLLVFELVDYLKELLPFLTLVNRLPATIGGFPTNTITTDSKVASCLTLI